MKNNDSFTLWVILVFVISTFILLVISGCGVEVRYVDEMGRVFEYKRTGPQQIGEVLMELPDGTMFLMDGQKSDMPPLKITLPYGIIIETREDEVKP